MGPTYSTANNRRQSTAARIVAATTTFAFLLGFAGCSPFTREQASRGSLSEAVEKSSDDYKEKRKTADSWIVKRKRKPACGRDTDATFCLSFLFERDDDEDVYCERRAKVVRHESRTPKHPGGPSPDVSFGFGVQGGTGIAPVQALSLNVGVHTSPVSSHLFETGFGHHSLQWKPGLSGSLSGLYEWRIGYRYQRSLLATNEAGSPFVYLGAGVEWMCWEYRNTIVSDVYDDYGDYVRTDKISADRLLGASAEFGGGYEFFRGRAASIVLLGGIGFTGFADKTHQGFYNDLFPGHVRTRAGLEMNFRLP